MKNKKLQIADNFNYLKGLSHGQAITEAIGKHEVIVAAIFFILGSVVDALIRFV